MCVYHTSWCTKCVYALQVEDRPLGPSSRAKFAPSRVPNLHPLECVYYGMHIWTLLECQICTLWSVLWSAKFAPSRGYSRGCKFALSGVTNLHPLEGTPEC